MSTAIFYVIHAVARERASLAPFVSRAAARCLLARSLALALARFILVRLHFCCRIHQFFSRLYR